MEYESSCSLDQPLTGEKSGRVLAQFGRVIIKIEGLIHKRDAVSSQEKNRMCV